MTQPAKVQEPSMEEILASIRRIIADDEAKPPLDAVKSASPAEAISVKPSSPSDKLSSVAVAKPPLPRPDNSQNDLDSILAELDQSTTEAENRRASSEVDVLELTDEMALPKESFSKIEPQDDIEFHDDAPAGARLRATNAASSSARTSFDAAATSAAQQVMSRSTVSAVESAFNTLAHTVLSNNARTLEDLVREMLRPMLKTWLDDNLPGLVERIVKAEIERVSRGR